MSDIPSLSSSKSWLSPIPSLSLSNHSFGSFGNASSLLSIPSPSLSKITETGPPPPLDGEIGLDIGSEVPAIPWSVSSLNELFVKLEVTVFSPEFTIL